MSKPKCSGINEAMLEVLTIITDGRIEGEIISESMSVNLAERVIAYLDEDTLRTQSEDLKTAVCQFCYCALWLRDLSHCRDSFDKLAQEIAKRFKLPLPLREDEKFTKKDIKKAFAKANWS